ncbi:MAG: hypothetical protein ABSE97_08845 [Verrucomicrobiota bacterium]|jgi:hypothetical protein
MAKIKIQNYPRRDDYLAKDKIFPRPKTPITSDQLFQAITKAFERCLKDKRGNVVELPRSPEELVQLCLQHLKERSDPILSPYFLSQCKVEEIFELDAVAHEMQRHRMRIGVFYQFLLIELMRFHFSNVADGKREGDAELEIDTPGFTKGLRLFISVKKSSDTVGGQDIGGVIRRLEGIAIEDKNLTRPYICVVCFATPQRGIILPYEQGRSVRRNRDGYPYSPNCEVWSPGFVFPYVCGLDAEEVYRVALQTVGQFLPFHSLSQREKCGKMLAEELKNLKLVAAKTGRLDPLKFQRFVTQRRKEVKLNDED